MIDSAQTFREFVEVIARLRDPKDGCPWDLEQTHQSLKRYLIEEAYEVLEAIDGNPDKLCEELGDLLLQIVLHAQIASEAKAFTMDKVVQGIKDKMVIRHPHIFGNTKVKDAAEVKENWERIKAEGKGDEKKTLSGIPKSLPSLLRSQMIGEKVARVGFDWETAEDVAKKVEEEWRELEAELLAKNQERIKEELGDLLFSLAQLARILKFEPESILQEANNKFTRRFEALEKKAGDKLGKLSSAELEQLWLEVKMGQSS